MVRAFLIAVLVLACSRERSHAQPLQPAPAATKPGPVIVLAFAAFNDDQLSECDEIFIRPPKALSPDAGAAVASFGDQMWDAMNKPQKGLTITRLSRKCGAQFGDRQPFGWCYDQTVAGSKDIRADTTTTLLLPSSRATG